MKMYFYNFFKDKDVFTQEELNSIYHYESTLSEKTYVGNTTHIGKIIFKGSPPHPLIFTNYKAFDREPFTNVELQRRGLHIFRIIFSHYALKIRRKIKGTKFDEAEIYDTIGVVKFPNLMGPLAEQVYNEMKSIPYSVNKQSFNTIRFLNFDIFPNLHKAIETIEPIIFNIIGGSQADMGIFIKYNENTFVQKIVNSPDDNDEQKEYHSDIFFPAVKFWYFPRAVELGKGTFMFVPHSVNMEMKMLQFYYDQSIKIAQGQIEDWRGRGHGEGSLRLSEEEIELLGLYPEPQVVEADTLVIGNVFGVHARGDTSEKSERWAIHGSIRMDQPFMTI